MDVGTFIDKPLHQAEPIFIVRNQCTIIYENGARIRSFGTNEGGPTYEIYIDGDGIILDIKVTTFGY
jgi:hypothetical protein